MRQTLRTLLLTTLLSIPLAVLAEWTLVGQSIRDAKIYYETTSITRASDKVRVWIMIDMPSRQPDGSLSLREYWEMNCREISYRILQQEKYPEHQNKGPRISGETDAGDWRYIGPDGIDRIILKRACL
jgi:hypothetical protein